MCLVRESCLSSISFAFLLSLQDLTCSPFCLFFPLLPNLQKVALLYLSPLPLSSSLTSFICLPFFYSRSKEENHTLSCPFAAVSAPRHPRPFFSMFVLKMNVLFLAVTSRAGCGPSRLLSSLPMQSGSPHSLVSAA